MDIFSTTIEVIKLINSIHAKYSDYRSADQTIGSMQHRLECVEIRLEMFREHLSNAKQGLTKDAQRVLRQSLQKVGDLLYDLRDQLPSDIRVRTKLSWIGWKKRRVDDLLSQLKTWEEEVGSMIFTYSLLLNVLAIKNFDSLYERLSRTDDQPLIGALALARRIHGGQNLKTYHIPVSSLVPAVRPVLTERVLAQYESSPVYLEKHGPQGSDALKKMAAAFRSPDLPSMHLLSCLGFTVWHGSEYFLVYQIPTLTPGIVNPARLPMLAYVLDNDIRMALEDRFRIAVEITTAVMEIHAAGWVHKSIRSDNVLVSTRGGGKGRKGDAEVSSAYLVGFTTARSQAVSSGCYPATDPIHSLYHHPERQGGLNDSVVRFDIRHDMYSLGALLIEIGFGKTLRVLFSLAMPTGSREDNHKRLLDHAHRLSTKMGSKYAGVAMTCLTKSTPGFQKKTEEVRKEFYEDVLCPLQEIMDGFKKKKRV